MIYSRELFDRRTVETVRDLLKDLTWVDGLVSRPDSDHSLKKNFQAINDESNELINMNVMNSIDSDHEFMYLTLPSKSYTVTISKTCEGGYYYAHHDQWYNGDYSTTVFLNDDYEGGELCIGDREVKLPAGHAVTYQTGIPHLVKPVTSGERYVAVFWTKSIIQDPTIRSICSDLQRAVALMDPPIVTSIEEAKTDPTFLVRNSLMELKRRYGQM